MFLEKGTENGKKLQKTEIVQEDSENVERAHKTHAIASNSNIGATLWKRRKAHRKDSGVKVKLTWKLH